jgi:hypothetical protein
MNDEVATGDLQSTAKGSGARKNGGKVMFHQIPLHLMGGVARVLMGGMEKYAPLNWAKGMDWSVKTSIPNQVSIILTTSCAMSYS